MGATATLKAYQFRVAACNNANCSVWTTGPKFTFLPVDNKDTTWLSYGGTWTHATLQGAYGATVRFASTANNKVQLNNSVSGHVAWVSTLGPDRGRASVSVDGGPAQTIDLCATGTQAASVVWSATFAAGTQHQVVVQVLGTKNAASSSTCVDVDAFVAIK